jgi:hypothetical protein
LIFSDCATHKRPETEEAFRKCQKIYGIQVGRADRQGEGGRGQEEEAAPLEVGEQEVPEVIMRGPIILGYGM